MPKELDFAEWDTLDPIKLAFAAHLWLGLHPHGNQVPHDSPAYLLFQKLKQEVEVLGILGPTAGYPKGYSRVPRADLKKIAESWGEQPAFLYPEKRPPATSLDPTIKAETKCREWLVGLMKNGNKKKSKSAYRTEANAKYGVSNRAFDRAWGYAVADTGNKTWNRPGRISKH